MPCARFVSVSELLGDADQRYFSAGYRAVRQDLRGIRLYTDDHGAIRVGASLALSYPRSPGRRRQARRTVGRICPPLMLYLWHPSSPKSSCSRPSAFPAN